MHSSRMHTTPLLPVSPSMHSLGGVPGGVPGPIIFLDRNPWNRKEAKMVDISRIFGFHLQPLSGVWFIHLLCLQWNEFVMENGIKTRQLNKNLILKPRFSLICGSSVLLSLVVTRCLKSL